MNGFTQFLLYLTLLIPGPLLIFWLGLLPFQEKKTKEPERTAQAELSERRVESGTNRSGRSSGMGYSYVLTFRTEPDKTLERYAYGTEYGALREGALTWKGPYFASFQPNGA